MSLVGTLARDEIVFALRQRDLYIYIDLPPGHDVFHVIAFNHSGVWNNQGALLTFTTPHTWYQTPWFKALATIAALCLLWLFTVLRGRRVEREVSYRFEAQMTERTRIARELHDTLLQSLQGLILSVSNFSSQASAPPHVSQELENALDRAEELLVAGRERIRDLRSDSAPRNNLEGELRALIERIDCPAPSKITLEPSGNTRHLKSLVQDEVLWIMREALTNACQHAGATQIHLRVAQVGIGLRCAVHDDGRGIETSSLLAPPAGRFGIVGMRERAVRIGGRLKVESAAGAGTVLTLFVPARIAYEDEPTWMGRLFS